MIKHHKSCDSDNTDKSDFGNRINLSSYRLQLVPVELIAYQLPICVIRVLFILLVERESRHTYEKVHSGS